MSMVVYAIYGKYIFQEVVLISCSGTISPTIDIEYEFIMIYLVMDKAGISNRLECNTVIVSFFFLFSRHSQSDVAFPDGRTYHDESDANETQWTTWANDCFFFVFTF